MGEDVNLKPDNPVTLEETHMLHQREVSDLSNFLLQPVQKTNDHLLCLRTQTIQALQNEINFLCLHGDNRVTIRWCYLKATNT